MTLNKDKYSNEYYKYKNKLIPLRYMAQESLKRDEYSTLSDIYSCGILIWECLVRGKSVPFDHLDNEAYLKAVQTDTIDHQKMMGLDAMPEKVKNILVGFESLL
jgi:serine/threonine protein kinase